MASPRGHLDVPVPGATVGPGAFQLLGWAADGRGSVAVDIEIDGALVGRANIGLSRPDVAEALGHANAAFAGWECMLDLHRLAAGRPSLRIDAFAQGRDGGRTLIGTVAIAVETAAPAFSESPAAARAGELRRRLELLLARHPTPPPPPPSPARPVRILAVLHSLDRGGSQLILLERLRELAAAGEAEAMVVSQTDGPLRDEFEASGFPCHVSGWLVQPDPVLYEGKMAELAMWCRPQGFELVLASTIGVSPAIDLALRLGLPSLWLIYERPVSKHHLSPFLSMRWPAYAIAQAEDALRRCSLIVFDSDACRRDYLHRAPPERLLTIPGAIDLRAIDRFRAGFDRAAARRAHGLPDDAVLVLGLGSILVLKGTPLLLQAFATLAGERADLRLALVGSRRDALAEALERFVAARGLGDRVRIEPMGAAAYDWLAMADLLVCPSHRESMPRTVMEGMAFEVPVVASAVGDVPSVLVDGTTGWLIPPSDPAALEQAMRRALAASPEQRGRMVEAAARHVREHRDAPRAAASFAEAVRRVAVR